MTAICQKFVPQLSRAAGLAAIALSLTSLIASLYVIFLPVGSVEAAPAKDITPEASAGPYLLDDYPGALAAYSLRRLSSAFDGPLVRIRRSSDLAESDFGLAGDVLDVAAVEQWLGSADGYVVKWYSQLPGHPALGRHTNDAAGEPLDLPIIAENGIVLTDEEGLPRLSFVGGRGMIVDSPGLPQQIAQANMTIFMLIETAEGPDEGSAGRGVFQTGYNQWGQHTFTLWCSQVSECVHQNWKGSGFGWNNTEHTFGTRRTMYIAALGSSRFRVYDRHWIELDQSVSSGSFTFDRFSVGSESRDGGTFWDGYVSEVFIYPHLQDNADVMNRYQDANAFWNLGPATVNESALLPQQFQYQVDIYDWLETLSVADVTLPDGTYDWDGTNLSQDDLADIWLQMKGVTASSVVRGSPEWYVLDAGNGKGIEATGSIRVWHEPHGDNHFGGGYGGNPARSWSNEPAFLYQLSLPLADGTEGNPYYHDPAMGRRALVVAAVDMMVYHDRTMDGNGFAWTDMFGKALLGWAEAYRWTKDVLDAGTQNAFENGFGYFLDRIIQQGARGVNTNMDMFPMKAAAEIYMSTDNLELREKAVQAVKRTLFGYPDGELEQKHDVFTAQGQGNGVFGPAGYIMEGGQPDIFYQGESLYHLMGALAAVTDRETGQVEADWLFLEEVVERIVEWESYQMFYDPSGYNVEKGGYSSSNVYSAGAGFSGRTSAGVPAGQAPEPWKHISVADRFGIASSRADYMGGITTTKMNSDISGTLNVLEWVMSSEYTETPPTWNGWSPWTKKTPYLPPKGWYTRLKNLHSSNDPARKSVVEQEGVYYNRSFGGYPTGPEYWAYKNTDGDREWGFFVEAHARQGEYDGWYGGKIETFWTESTGIVLMNRHGRTGCDLPSMDSVCFENLDEKAGHHVWGRDEHGGGFTTLLLRGRNLNREANFDLEAATPMVSVHNKFNDPGLSAGQGVSGEETGDELQGSVDVVNRFETEVDGVRVTHTVTSNESDQVTELWASLPVFLRNRYAQKSLNDTSIEYWTGSAWQALPEDMDSDGVPAIVSTTSLRLGRDFFDGQGAQYAYVDLESAANVRLSTGVYEDPYQTGTRARTVHLDLHGNPGTVRTLPAETSLSYSIVTTDPTGESQENSNPEINQVMDLNTGWNLVSRSIQLDNDDVSAVFAEIQDRIVLVKDEAGRAFIPEFGINEIGPWAADEALMVNVDTNTSLTLSGTRIDPTSLSIELQTGWNLLPYVLTTALPVQEALGGITADVELLKDREGNLYFPEFDIDEIGVLSPGLAYKIYVGRDVSLTYPAESSSGSKRVIAGSSSSSEIQESNLYGGHLVVESRSTASPEYISIRTNGGREVGSGTVVDDQTVIAIAGDDPFTTDVVEGAKKGELLRLERVVGDERTTLTSPIRDALSGQDVSADAWQFQSDGVWMTRIADVPTHVALRQNYPNPFNPTTTIQYELTEPVPVQISVFNSIGQEVAVLVNGIVDAGTHEATFDAANLGSGLYIYRMQAAGEVFTRTMMLLK